MRGPPAPPGSPEPARSWSTTSWGLRTIRIAPPSSAVVRETPPITAEETDLGELPSSGGSAPLPADVAPTRPDPAPSTPLQRLRPRAGDPRIWGERPGGPDPPAGVIQLLRGIDAYNALRIGVPTADDWTYATWVGNDDVGDRWGAAPGVIFVGGVAIPICQGRTDASECGFGLPPSRREEYKLRLRALIEIGRQRAWSEIRARADSIRRRRNAERDSVIRR